MIKKLLFPFTLLLLACCAALAQPPWDLSVTFDAPTSGGPVQGYRLYINNTYVQDIVSGDVVTASIPSAGTYVVGVTAYNTAGEGPMVTQVLNVTELSVPGAPTNLRIVIECNPCVIDITE